MQQDSIISKQSTLVKLPNLSKAMQMSPPEKDNQIKTFKNDAIEYKSIN
jgi:hypothetical protein